MTRHILLAVTLFAFTCHANGQTVDGTWKWTTTMGDNTIDSTLVLESDGDEVSGLYKDQNIEEEIENVSLDGDELSFEVTTEFNGNDLNVQFRGTVQESSIDGMAYIFVNGQQRGDGFPWNPQRHVRQSDVTGTWQFDFTDPNGTRHQPVIDINLQDGDLVGTRSDEGEKIETVKLNGDQLTIAYSASYNGSPIDLKYTLRPRGNQMTGKLAYDLSGQTGEIDVKATRQTLPAELKKLLGKWKFTVVGDDGVERHPVITLSDDNGQLGVTMTDDDKEYELTDVAYEDGKISFNTSNQHDGLDVDITWTMNPSGEGMVGTLAYDAGGNTGEIDFTGIKID